MDFTKLDVGVSAPAKQETAFTKTFDQFKNGNGEPLSVTLLAFASPEGRKELRKWQMRYGTLSGDHSAASEDDLNKLADKADAGDVEMIARVIKGWNLQQANGKVIECSLENRMAFLRAYQPVADAIASEVVQLAADLGKSKPA